MLDCCANAYKTIPIATLSKDGIILGGSTYSLSNGVIFKPTPVSLCFIPEHGFDLSWGCSASTYSIDDVCMLEVKNIPLCNKVQNQDCLDPGLCVSGECPDSTYRIEMNLKCQSGMTCCVPI